MSDTLSSEETIFEGAQQRAAGERAAYLEAACGGDADLRARVETLLAAHDQAGSFLEMPAVGERTKTMDHAAATEKPGTKIGPYKLLEQIGEGGFGVVYMAEQEKPIRRKVALKIIKPGMDTRQVIARFEAERQALALMDHPNIAQVFDAGETASGRPYFVMELVKGIPITAYCDRAKLPLYARLKLFLHVCQAVQHAHHKGIVHRDIKPTNVLVTRHGGQLLVKVIDFGIAKAMGQELTDKTLFTSFGQVLGTPLYSSPEQVALGGMDIDTRTDVYSLGVVLYELLTGTTPFEKERLNQAAMNEMLRIIREENPPRPSTRMTTGSQQTNLIAAQRASQPRRLAQIFRGELDWIVMKALEKDRTRRYETPVALAGDVARYLANEPVSARPPSNVYRVGKFVRRHTWGTAVAAAAVLLLGLGTVLIWNEQRKTANALARVESTVTTAEEQRQLAIARQQEAEEQRRLADDQRKQVVARQQEVEDQRQLALQKQAEAEAQRTLATAAAAREQKAAEQERQAKESAVRAEREVMLRLADNYTSRGFDGDNASQNALAALWFANAAVTAHDDPDRVQANLLRVNNWWRDQWTPVAVAGTAKGPADHVSFDPQNSRYLITFTRHGGIDAPPQIWDLATEQPLHPSADYDPLSDAVWTSGGQVVLGSAAGHVALASMPDLKILNQWDTNGPVKRVAASADGRVVAATCGKKLIAWAASSKNPPALVEHPEEIAYIGFSPTSDYLLTATDGEAKVRVFAVEANSSATPRLRLTLGPVTHIYRKFQPDSAEHFARPPLFVNGGQGLVTLPGSAKIKWYDTPSGAELENTQNSVLADIGVHCTAVSPDGRTVQVGRMVFNAGTRKPIHTFGATEYAAFNLNGSLIANSSVGVEVCRIGQGQSFSRPFPIVNMGDHSAFSNDGKYLAVLNTGLVQVWRIPASSAGAQAVHKVSLNGGSGWAGFSRDGQYMVPIGWTYGPTKVRTLQVCETATGRPAGSALSLDADLVSADFSPDGRLVATLTGIKKDKRQLRLWNWQTGNLACPAFPLDSEPIWAVFAPDGKAMAVHCMNGSAILIDPATGSESRRVQCRATRPAGSYPWASGRGTICFSRDGRTFFTWGSTVVQAWDRLTGRERFAVTHREPCWAAAESPDGRILATASYDGDLRLCDTANGKELYPPLEHPDQVLTVAFSPDGRLIGTSCVDAQTRVWEVSTGTLAYVVPSIDILFTPDGRFDVTTKNGGLQMSDSKTGYVVSRLIPTGIFYSTKMDISPDEHWALIGGMANSITVVDLQPLTVVPKSSPQEALLWTELLSNSRIVGSNIVNLTNREWLERWRHYGTLHPEVRFSGGESARPGSSTPNAAPAPEPPATRPPVIALKQPRVAANAAVVVVRALRSEEQQYVNNHSNLRNYLSTLEARASVLLNDDGRDAATTARLRGAFSVALEDAISFAESIAQRTNETPEAVRLSRQVAARLRDAANK
jgi:serine/threonine protein kinase/WD40 repeat protein